ncbi:3-hydroxybutyryl-CoA dehydrogenase [Kineosporia sp. NBRC 101677]|uniref:3-hydroxyacyl-CoA dehydrogenase family protein n=1 Tax=Kineosporia sp. NBRC 101677 TaxID=3032197 RepID=UPI0024A2CA7A|nr:3-hydroxyacyl-CoA dehydrogenase family protein [Kineosporia sp. NBRC 101677]GLY15236.1 3-hydroxybutyryl-CoA dehydrogenase [Kineosporia sp. NBRC 101677]
MDTNTDARGPVDRLVIVGAGVMGTGIAAMVLGQGLPVVLVDQDATVLGTAADRVHRQIRHGNLLGAFSEPTDPTGPGDLVLTQDLEAVSGASAVIEAIVEEAAAKTKLLTELSDRVPPGTPLITNTSGIPVDELADSTARPEDVIGTHFMNPAYLIGMVETVRGPRTSELTLERVSELLGRLGRRVIVVQDSPGFVTSRLLHPLINDAARLVAAGTAPVEAVDQLMQGCLGHPTGPLRTADLIGIDNLVDALGVLAARTGNAHYRPCELLVEMARAGRLGRKSGSGFYEYGEVAL